LSSRFPGHPWEACHLRPQAFVGVGRGVAVNRSRVVHVTPQASAFQDIVHLVARGCPRTVVGGVGAKPDVDGGPNGPQATSECQARERSRGTPKANGRLVVSYAILRDRREVHPPAGHQPQQDGGGQLPLHHPPAPHRSRPPSFSIPTTHSMIATYALSGFNDTIMMIW